MNGAKNYVFNLSWWKAVYCPPRCVCSNRGESNRTNNGICCWGEFPHRHDKADANNMLSLCPLKCTPTKVQIKNEKKLQAVIFLCSQDRVCGKTVFCDKCSQLGCKQNFVESFLDFKVWYQNNRSNPDHNQKIAVTSWITAVCGERGSFSCYVIKHHAISICCFFSVLNLFQVKRGIIEFSWVYQNLGVTLGA